jgi:hypothetical protein
MLTTISIVRSKPEDWQPRIKKHVEHWQKYVEYLNHIELLFRAGRKKEDVLQAIINMHRSIKRWEEVAREQARNPVPPVKLLKAAFLSKGGRWRYLVVDQPPGEDVRLLGGTITINREGGREVPERRKRSTGGESVR